MIWIGIIENIDKGLFGGKFNLKFFLLKPFSAARVDTNCIRGVRLSSVAGNSILAIAVICRCGIKIARVQPHLFQQFEKWNQSPKYQKFPLRDRASLK